MNPPNTVVGGSHVSIVDDDPSFGISMRRLIVSFGFKADVFLSAQAFLESRRVEDTVCLLLDLRMTGVDGLALQRHLRDNNHLVPIIFVTEHASSAERREAMQAGALHILKKPVNPRALLESLLEVILQPQPSVNAGENKALSHPTLRSVRPRTDLADANAATRLTFHKPRL